jgi:hypothetical protein
MERDDLSDALESQAVSIEELNAKDKRIAELKDRVATLERESRQVYLSLLELLVQKYKY